MECQSSEITDKTGKAYIMQSAHAEDAEELMAFAKQASKESPYFPWSREGCPKLWENTVGYINTFLIAPRYTLFLLRNGENIADAVRKIKDWGFLSQLTLSLDICGTEDLKTSGGYGYVYLFETFLPMLKERGITQNDIDLILEVNPARLFA